MQICVILTFSQHTNCNKDRDTSRVYAMRHSFLDGEGRIQSNLGYKRCRSNIYRVNDTINSDLFLMLMLTLLSPRNPPPTRHNKGRVQWI